MVVHSNHTFNVSVRLNKKKIGVCLVRWLMYVGRSVVDAMMLYAHDARIGRG
jgi:hypothetical protein